MASPLPIDRELIHLRQDNLATQEILRLVQSDNATLKAAVVSHKAALQKEVGTRNAMRDIYEGKLRDTATQLEALKGENAKLSTELAEALHERERQAAAIADVRRSVDTRLTRLMEELHKKEEEIHKLQFAVSERDRDRERALVLERMVNNREDNVNQLLSQLAAVRTEQAETAAELRHKTLLADQLTRAQESMVASSASPARGLDASEMAGVKEVLTILPLYRQWSSSLCSDLELVDDGLDQVLDTATDLRVMLQGGDLAAMQHDRQRLQKMRQMEKDRAKAQSNLLLSSAIHSDDPQGVHIHSIRATSDQARYEIERVKETVSTLADCVEHLKAIASSGHLRSDKSGAGRRELTDDEVIVGYTQPTSVAGAPLTSSVVRMSATAAAAHAAEVSRLQESLSAKDAKLLDTQREVFEWREKASAAESQARMLERELGRASSESEVSRTELRKAEEELRITKSQIYTLQGDHMKALDEARSTLAAASADHSRKLREADDSKRIAVAEATEHLNAELQALRSETSSLQRHLAEATSTEARLRAILEESKQKRLEWKRAKENCDEELNEARATLSTQNRELRQAQDLVETLSAELAHVKDVLDFESQQQERRALMGAAGDGFQQWKLSQQEEVRAAQAAAARLPRKIVVRRKI